MYSLEKLQESVKRNQEGKLELNLSSKNLSTVPEAISQLTEVQVLDLSDNRRITQLPAELNKLENLSCLRLSGCVSLKSFPPSQYFPAQLKELHVDRCGLIEIGTAITELCGLEKLNVSNNSIRKVPDSVGTLVELKELDCTECHLTEVDAITKLTGLEKLDLSGNPIKSIPGTISRLIALKELSLKRCKLTKMKSEITELTGLEKLDLTWNPIKSIPGTISRLIALKELRLLGCELTEMKSEITELTGLEKLDLTGNPIKSIPGTISRLIALKELRLVYCELTEMKSEITELTGLEKLDLTWNPIKSIPGTISRLIALKELSLQRCELTEMKSEITELTGVEKLNLSDNPIKSIPGTISRLIALRNLSLWGCELTEMKSEITELISLEKLDLSGNPITSITDTVGKLRRLKHFELSECKLQGVPESLFDMKSLERLNLAGNQLKGLPLGILNLNCWLGYDELDLTGNPLVLPPESVCSQGSEAMFNFLLEYRQQNTVHLRVVLVGSSGAGKTSLVKTLISGVPSLVKEDDRTVVLERSNWGPYSTQCNVNIQVVDFGGQDWYRVVHPFFLDKDALILLAVNLSTYSRGTFDKDVGSWLHVLESRIQKATVRFVLTQADQVDKQDIASMIDEIQKLALQGDCGNALEHVRIVSSKTMENIKELQEEIVQLAVENGRKIPSSWLSLHREMCLSDDVKKKEFLMKEDVKRMFKMLTNKRYSVVERMLKTTEQRCRDVLSFLHSTGIITWYDHPAELSNYVFHQPEYLAELLKAVFAENHSTYSLRYTHAAFNTKFSSVAFEKEKESLLQRGVMSRTLLRGLWEHMKLDEKLFNGMMQLLVKFDLCYILSSNEDGDVEKLMFPWFLKEAGGPEVNQVIQRVPAIGCYRLTLEYRFVAMCPPPLYEKLAVRIHHRIQDTDSRRDWKDGVLAEIFNSQVVVRRVTNGGETVISIAVEGRDPVELWEVLLGLKEDMTSLMREWPGVKFERWLVCPHCVQSAVKPAHRFPGDYVEKTIPWRQLWMTCQRGGFKVPACLVYPVKDIYGHLDQLKQFTQRLEKHCIPSEQTSAGHAEECAEGTDSQPDRKEMVDPSSVPDLKILLDLSRKIVPCWESLGLRLDLSQDDIDNITFDNTISRPNRKAYEMLKTWQQKQEDSCTYQTLADALRCEGLEQLAKKYC